MKREIPGLVLQGVAGFVSGNTNRGNAWKIVIKNGLDEVDNWIVRMTPQADENIKKGDSKTKAWRDLLQNGIDGTDENQAMATEKSGGIDLTPANMNLQTKIDSSLRGNDRQG